MTAGTIQIGGNPEVATHPPGFRFKRTWSGTDGKTFSYAGGTKTKWNFYSAQISLSRIGNQTYTGKFWNNYPTLPKQLLSLGPANVSSGLLGPEAAFTSNDQLKLLSKLTEKVKGHDFNLAVNLAQGRQVVDMVTSNLAKIAKSVRALKHGDFATAARQLGARPRTSRLNTKDVSGRWLELQYGWLPLLGDTYEATRAYAALTAGPRSKMYKVTMVAARKDIVAVVGDFKYTTRNKIRRQIIFEQYEKMSAPRSLGLTDPYSVAWEVIPYSFVVDWFVPIGTYLDVMNSIPELVGRFLTTTTTTREGMFFRRDYSSDPNGRTTISQMPTRDAKQIDVLRQPSTAINPPLPTFVQGLSGTRIWNAISLAHQAFS